MASTIDTVSPLAERLMSRSESNRRIGAGSRLLKRFGMQNPYEGGPVGDPSAGEQRFSFLSSEAYFAELRGLTSFRGRLLSRIGRVRAAISAHERFERHIGTVASRALHLGSADVLAPTFIDWSNQLDSMDLGEEGESSVPRAARRQTAIERALRSEISSASKMLSQLERVASVSRSTTDSKVRSRLTALSQLPAKEQADASFHAAQGLKGVASVAARGTELHPFAGGIERNGERPLAVAQRRQDAHDPRGLKRVLRTSPVVMELEHPAKLPAEEAVPTRRSRAAQRPAVREHAHRSAPTARVAKEARSQGSVGRAGPPAVGSAPKRAPQRSVRSILRPTARIARTAHQASNTPLYNATRGMSAALSASAPSSPAARVGRRLEAGVVSSSGQVVPGVSWARSAEGAQAGRQSGAVEVADLKRRQLDILPEEVRRVLASPGDDTSDSSVEQLPPMARAVQRTQTVRPQKHRLVPERPRHSSVNVEREAAPLTGAAASNLSRLHRIDDLVESPDPVGQRTAVASRSLTAERGQEPSSLGQEEMRLPQTVAASDGGAQVRPSMQRKIASKGSRRNVARPTVRAASRAVVQERAGVRGRMLAPSVSGHVDLTTSQQALDLRSRVVAPFNRANASSLRESVAGGQKVQTLATLPEDSIVHAVNEANSVEGAATRTPAGHPVLTRPPRSSTEKVSSLQPRSSIRPTSNPERRPSSPMAKASAGRSGSRPSLQDVVAHGAPRRLANTSRAVARSLARQRTGESGGLLMPRVVAPFVQETPGHTALLARAGGVASERSVVSPEMRSITASSPTECTLLRAASGVSSQEPTGLAVRASRRGRVVPDVARRTITPTVTPELQSSVARQTFRRVMEQVSTHGQETQFSKTHRTRVQKLAASAALRTPKGFASPARVFRTSSVKGPGSSAWRTPSSRFEAARLARTGSRTHEPSAVAAARAQDPSQLGTSGFPVGAGLDPVLLDSVFEPTIETPVAESALGRAMRRMDTEPTSLTASPMMESASLVLAKPLKGVVEAPQGRTLGAHRDATLSASALRRAANTPRVRETSHALGRSVSRRSSRSVLANPVPSARTADAATRLMNRPGFVDGVLLSRSEAIEHDAVGLRPRGASLEPSSRVRMQQALEAVSSIHASKRSSESVLTLPAVRRSVAGDTKRTSPKRAELEARLELAEDGTVLRAVVSDTVTGERLQGPMRQAEDRLRAAVAAPIEREQPRSQRLADDRFVPVETRNVASPSEGVGRTLGQRVGVERGISTTLDALVRPTVGAPAEGKLPLLRRRAWNRRSMAAELGVQTPLLSGADHVPDDQRLASAPAWARRAGTGTAAQVSPEQRQVRPERETNGLMGALARAERPDEIVKVILDRRTEIREIRQELPKEAVRLVERIGSLTGPEVQLLQSGQRLMRAPEQNMLQSRSHRGSSDITQLTAGQDGMGATRIMKLADKLMGLIHLAENSRQKEAQNQVRMAQDSLEARAEGGSQFPGLSVEDHDMNIEQLQKSVLSSVMEHFEELESRGRDQDGGHNWF